MASNNLTEFYNNWNSKIENINDENLSGIYDKFITYFIIYNNLYNQVPEKLVKNGKNLPDRLYDNKCATDYVVDFLGASILLDELENKNKSDINTLKNIIENEYFFIKLKNGQNQRDKDLEILKNLNSNNKRKKVIAILQIVYYVRCNIFHGHKGFKEYQRLIIDPLNKILETINPLLFSKL